LSNKSLEQLDLIQHNLEEKLKIEAYQIIEKYQREKEEILEELMNREISDVFDKHQKEREELFQEILHRDNRA
jgi:hypothetical protein